MTPPLSVSTALDPGYGATGGPRSSTAASKPGVLARCAAPALRASVASWFAVAIIGQVMLAIYVVGFYWRAAIDGKFETWNKVLQHGYIAGDTAGNLVVASHLAFAVVVTIAGALQFIPMVRRRWPAFHRWNGRVYLTSVLVMSVGGLTMILTRGAPGDLSQSIALSISALLIIGCAAMTLHHARARRIDVHRRWALRLFLVASGGWFFRVGLMFWIVVNQGPVGFDPKTFTGPFLTFLAFAEYIVPLAVLELYFCAQKSHGTRGPIAMAAGLATLTLIMAVGIIAATMIMWLPRL